MVAPGPMTKTVVGAEQKSHRAHANSRWAQAENRQASPKSHRARAES